MAPLGNTIINADPMKAPWMVPASAGRADFKLFVTRSLATYNGLPTVFECDGLGISSVKLPKKIVSRSSYMLVKETHRM